MAQTDDLSRCLAAFDQDTTLVVVVEMSQSNWLAAALVPGLDRQPLKKMAPDQTTLLRLVERWRDEAVQAGRTITRTSGCPPRERPTPGWRGSAMGERHMRPPRWIVVDGPAALSGKHGRESASTIAV